MKEKEIKLEEDTTEEIIETKKEEKKELTTKVDTAQELGLVVPKNMGDYVDNTMKQYIERGLTLPTDYNVSNAVISSFLIIKQDEKLANCTKDSIAGALIDMATMGLNVAKGQGFFIPYAGKLTFSPSYFGKITAIQRIRGVVDVLADVIYKDTEYDLSVNEYGTDEIKITKSCPLDKRKHENIIGAWAKIILDEKIWGRKEHTTIMTMEQIEKAWNQGQMKGKSPAHLNFKDEMAKKSVINRCCKQFVNSAKDQDILIETLNRTTGNDYQDHDNEPTIIKEAKVIEV